MPIRFLGEKAAVQCWRCLLHPLAKPGIRIDAYIIYISISVWKEECMSLLLGIISVLTIRRNKLTIKFKCCSHQEERNFV